MGFLQKHTNQKEASVTTPSAPVSVIDQDEDQSLETVRQQLIADLKRRDAEFKARVAKANQPIEQPYAADPLPTPVHRGPGRPPKSQSTEYSPDPADLPKFNQFVSSQVDPLAAIDDLTAFLSTGKLSTIKSFLEDWFTTSCTQYFRMFLKEVAQSPDLRTLSDKTDIGYANLYQMLKVRRVVTPKAMLDVLAAYGYGIEVRILPFAKIAQDYVAMELNEIDYKGEV